MVGSSPAEAVDVVGYPGVQDSSSYWQAASGATGTDQRSWTLLNLGGISLTAVQARLFMPTPAAGSITFRAYAHDTGEAISSADQALTGTWSDHQLVGTNYATPVPNVGRVAIVFSQISVAPGLRTVGVYRPVSAQDRGRRALLDRVSGPLVALASLFVPRRAEAAPLEQGYPSPSQPTAAPAGATRPMQPAGASTPIPAAPLTGNPFPGAPLATATPVTVGPASSLAPPPAPRGRVSFLIVAQIRPGAP